MWKLHRYYLKEVAATSLLTFAVLFGIVLISLVARGVEEAKGGDLGDAALIVLLWAADIFPHLLALSLLFGAVLTFARAAQDREITAVRSAGISPRVPMTAALLLGVACSIAGLWATHYLIPRAHFNKYRVVTEIAYNLVVGTQMTGDQLELQGGRMTWDRRTPDGRFHDVVILRGRKTLITAREAWFEVDSQRALLSLRFRDAAEPASGALLTAPSMTIDLREVAERRRRTEGDRDLTSDQLLAEVQRGVHPAPGGARYTVHRRSCFGLLPLLLTPLGFCIGVMSRDRGRMTALVFSLLPIVLCYAGDVAGQKLIQHLDLPLLGWLPALALGLFGVPYCWRLLRV
jgi:lipopolysaccharide export LptBFGC system permease protein LptF